MNDDNSCQVLDEILSGNDGMNALLTRTVPQHGPPALMKTKMCKPLRDDILEFRKNPTGAKLRVLWFYGTTGLRSPSSPLTVVCTHGFLKKQREVPPIEIERAIRLRATYLHDQALGTNEVYGLDLARLR